MNKITVYNLSNLPTAPLEAFHELQEDFKIQDRDKLSKLQMIIITRGFKYAFVTWQDTEDKKLYIIDAHQRRSALFELKKAGFEIPEIPYQLIHAETKKEAVEEIAAFNSEFGKKNPNTLLFEKYEIDTNTLGRFELGYEAKGIELTPVEFNPIFENTADTVREDEQTIQVPDETGSYYTQPGDVWLLGKNRLMRGDCRSNDDVRLLMNGKLAHASVTDPPYNVDYEGATKEELKIDNDSMERDLFGTFLRQVFKVMFDCLHPGSSNYIFHADSEGENFRKAYREAGFKLAQCLIWVKNQLVMGWQDYQWQHEPILYGWKPGAAHRWYSDRKQTTLLHYDKPQRNAIHPTMKPIALMAYPIQNSTEPGQIVIDFFSGSGSTLMACQQIDRICHAMEIDPRYVQATVERFRSMFSKQPTRLIRNGKEYTVEETLQIIANE
ncbi:MAG: site-specific DNA-methyltransferase [Tannerellaceae bacterium]|nr:site-specific DNA-methyltransferase [Tannerellaceae bacterium]